ncbi:MAG: acylphosphatase [Nitrospiraceae bacterium]|jgi:acylphosphatase|nr:acylphosphatase [Nitrospiraceae bacterium]
MLKQRNETGNHAASDTVPVRAHLFIDGRVQGVAYRYFTQNVAVSLNLAGWVRNLPDRRVEAVFEGDRRTIERAIQLCQEGPPFARVTHIETLWHEQPEGLTDFRIRY